MPNRILKDSICTSPEIDQLSPEAEVFFYRLIVNCDDYGLFDARIPILRARLFPLRNLKDTLVQQWLTEIVKVGLVKLYQSEGRDYLEMAKWAKHQQTRATKPKYPQPNEGNYQNLISPDINCNQLKSLAPVFVFDNSIRDIASPSLKTKYGSFENVLLTDGEHAKLISEFNGRTQSLIENLSAYIASKGAKYKSHYATILNWERKNKAEKPAWNAHG